MVKTAIGFVLLCAMLTACKDAEKEKGQEQKQKDETNSAQAIVSLFKQVKPPYQLSDTGLANNTDTASSTALGPLVADSIKNYFGKTAGVHYTPLARLTQQGKESYYVVKATSRNKTAAILLVSDEQNNFMASYPFLLPDSDPNTGQVSTIDKNFTITKTVTLRSDHEIVGEGKQVLSYDAAAKNFSLIMEDPLLDNPAILANPIDTFPKTHKLAGDYTSSKKNIVSVRDGRYPNQLLVFIHTENESGDCIGQMRGEFIMTSSSTAAFRQGGDPCVLNLAFKGNTVSINEERGCGNYRGLDCIFTGSFTRKKSASAKPPTKKPKTK